LAAFWFTTQSRFRTIVCQCNFRTIGKTRYRDLQYSGRKGFVRTAGNRQPESATGCFKPEQRNLLPPTENIQRLPYRKTGNSALNKFIVQVYLQRLEP